MLRNWSALLVLGVLVSPACNGSDERGSTATDTTADTQRILEKTPNKSKHPTPLSAQNVVALRKLVGNDVEVQGFVERTNKSRSGHQFLNFQASELTAVCFKNDVPRFTAGEPADAYKGKHVVIRGRLELYRNKLQIKLKDPDQIAIVEGSEPTATDEIRGPPHSYLKKIGSDIWISPAGLRYAGRDPEGRTRVEHVLRHARDIPKRAGSHGVFDGGEERVFPLIDEAWREIQKRNIRPRTEGDRLLYTVDMKRRIGYLGGQNGKNRGNPPLSRVFLVLKKQNNEVITAFPK